MLFGQGGIPAVRHLTAATDGSLNGADPSAPKGYTLPGATVWIAVQTDVAVKLYFSQADFDADQNSLTVTDVFDGPYSVRALWFRGVSALATVQLAMSLKG